MNIYSDICFKKPLEIIKAFDNEDFKTALNRVEELSKNYYLLGYIRYEAKDIFLNKIVKSKQPLLYFEAYETFEKYVPEKDGMLRVLLSSDGSFETEYKPLIEHSTNKIEISAQKVNSKEQFLYHKTTNRPWYKAAFEKIKAQEVYDVIFLNEKDELTEGARTNILLQIDGRLYTPKISSGLLNGVMRRIMLEQNKCEEKVLTLNDLHKAQKIFCINSVRGIVEVTL